MSDIPRKRKGDPLRANEVNALAEAVRRELKAGRGLTWNGGNTMSVSKRVLQQLNRDRREGRRAPILGRVKQDLGGGSYEVNEVVWDGGSTWIEPAWAAKFSSVQEINMAEGIPVDSLVFVCRATGPDESDWAWWCMAPTSVLVGTEVSVVTDFRVEGVELQVKRRTIYVLEADDETDWQTVHTGTECP
jgi:hypothetical protein